MKKPTAGTLRRRVIIEQPQRTPDGFGGSKVTWTSLATVWADVISFAGSMLNRAEQDAAHEPFRLIIRFRNDVTSDMRVNWKGRLLTIQSVYDPDGLRAWLALDCEEGLS